MAMTQVIDVRVGHVVPVNGRPASEVMVKEEEGPSIVLVLADGSRHKLGHNASVNRVS